ncbi:MAG: cysteine desulfurase [Patescibacteria group bacterium]|jgi:cysteine desulfurase/selenocysteine lyase
MSDLTALHQDFPILSRVINGKPLVYLDSAATSQRPEAVLKAMDDLQRHHNANVHRGIYQLSEEATALYEGSRERIAKFINAKSTQEIIFTRNATESINLVALSWARQNLKTGDEVLTTEMEHHSNIVPWQMLAKEQGIVLKFLPALPEAGILDMASLDSLLSAKTKLVCVGHMSNLLGTVNPIKEIVQKAHAVGAKVLVDGCQSAPHMPVDVQDLGCDFYAFSGHKMLGPSGIGVLWARQEIMEKTEPILGGGDMIKEVTKEASTWNDLPWKFEAGTPNIVGVVGLGAAVDYLTEIGMQNVWQHEQDIAAYVLPKLTAIAGVRLFGISQPDPNRGAAFSIWIDGMHPHDIASIFDERGIAIRAGHMCAQPMLARLGKPAAARASFYLYNTKEEADAYLNAIEDAKKVFGM